MLIRELDSGKILKIVYVKRFDLIEVIKKEWGSYSDV